MTLRAVDLSPGGTPELTTAHHRVTTMALTSVRATLVAAADLHAARTGGPVPAVEVTAEEAVGAFSAERRVTVDGGTPPLWDPLAGEYAASGTWVRLHTNYPHHRAAALAALGLTGDAGREDVAAAVAPLTAVEVEDAVAAAGGAAAALRTAEQWAAHPQSAAVAARPVVGLTAAGTPGPRLTRLGDDADPTRPLTGVRVLDLTRVIAGPTAGKVLAALGADVLRIDPPGFPEVPTLVADTTAGKRTAWLDLRSPDGAGTFADLVADADVVLTGLRPGAVDGLGWPVERLLAQRPGLVVGRLSAYGDTGPWGARRGFDSLVQLVTGLAAAETLAAGRALTDPLVALPLQVLDHASGWLLAAGVLRSLTDRALDAAPGATVDVVLARTAAWLAELGPADAREPAPAPVVEEVDSALGRVARVVAPGRVGGVQVTWGGPPVPLGNSAARW